MLVQNAAEACTVPVCKLRVRAVSEFSIEKVPDVSLRLGKLIFLRFLKLTTRQ